MACTAFSAIETFSDFLVWPTGCSYYFWLIILGALFVIIAWTLFKTEEKRRTEGDFISAMGVSSIAVTSIGVIGTLIKNGAGIPMIQSDVLLYMVALTVVIVLIWIFKD